MKHTLFLTIGLAALFLAGCTSISTTCGPILAESDDPAKVERELAALPRQWMEAWQRRDTEALGRILADDFTNISPAGSRTTKADQLRQAQTSQYEWTTVDDVRVRHSGDVAVVTYRSTGKVKAGTEVIPMEILSSVQYYRRSPGQWQATAAQHLSVPLPPPTTNTGK